MSVRGPSEPPSVHRAIAPAPVPLRLRYTGLEACIGVVIGLEPCPLCIVQRILLLAVGVAFLAAALHRPAGRLGAGVYGGVIAFIAAIGVAVAGRHVWLQHLPPEKRPACGPALDYLLSAFGPVEGLSRVLRGSGECGAVDWTLLSFSIPEWTLAAFMALAAWAVFLAPRN